MQLSFASDPRAPWRWNDTWLICLDLQREYVVPGRPLYSPACVEVADACIRVLRHGRERGWRIVHSQLRRDDESYGAGAFGAPIEGLRPLVTEPVYLRRTLSAFADPDFTAELKRGCGENIYLIGFSLADTCLATVLAAVDHGLRLIVVDDATGAGATTPRASEMARRLLAPFAPSVSSRELADEAGPRLGR